MCITIPRKPLNYAGKLYCLPRYTYISQEIVILPSQNCNITLAYNYYVYYLRRVRISKSQFPSKSKQFPENQNIRTTFFNRLKICSYCDAFNMLKIDPVES